MNFRRLLLATTGMTALTMLVGVYTAEFGAGLACEARWPLCDGAVYGLFPANIPSFIEWFHRLLAMITGFFIIGSTLQAYRQSVDNIIKYGLTIALIILPFQIILGGLTVTRYELLILTAHFATPLVILGGVVIATVWSYRNDIRPTTERIQSVLLFSLLGYPLLAILTPRLFFSYSWAAQMTFYTVGLALAALLVSVVFLAKEAKIQDSAVIFLAFIASLLIALNLIIGRLHFGDTGQLVMIGMTVLAFIIVAGSVHRLNNIGVESTAAV